jgi:TPR repeat protein
LDQILEKHSIKEIQKAAEQGNAKAQYDMSIYYAKGEGVEQNPVKSAYWCEKAAESFS